MIKVDVEEYCHACLDFSPETIKPQRMLADDQFVLSDTIIQCEHRRRCASIARYLAAQAKGDNNK